MFVMDVPPEVPAQYAPIVVAEATQAQHGPEVDRTMGVCHLIDNTPEERLSAVNAQSPLLSVYTYFRRVEQRDLQTVSGTVTLLEGPVHGTLEVHAPTQSTGYFVTDPGYEGPDQATLLVEIGGYRVKVIYYFQVMSGVAPGSEEYDPYEDPNLCPKGQEWRISLNPDDPDATVYTIPFYVAFAPDDPSAPVYTVPYPDQWSGLLAEATKVTVTFANLPGETLGQTVGNTITLDVDAAGHGWFVDETPWDNSEWLPPT